MKAHEVVGVVFLGIAIIGFLASIISSFFVENGRTKWPTKKSINTKVKKQPVFKDSSYDEDESDERSSSWNSTEKPKRHSGKCDGDCANCPPHYGYRHGRWYYGHDHVEGCEFGGNKGSGGRD